MSRARSIRSFARGLAVLFVLLVPISRVAAANEDALDRLEETLTFATPDAQARARLSGLIDLEQYHFQLPPPGVIRATGNDLFTPRLTLFLDAQLGSQLYLFAQARWDRGFDPQPAHGRVRLDEYALRYTPWPDGRLSVQAGRFGTIVGNWTPRHGAWTDAFISAPLAYEQLTGLWDREAITNPVALLRWSHVRSGLPAAITAREKDLRIPVLWGPAYATGFALSGDLGKFGYAAEIKHAPVSSRPETWEPGQVSFAHPSIGARLRYRPNAMWNLGFSATSGTYLTPAAERTLLPRHGRGDYRQITLGQDLVVAWHHWQFWAEVFEARYTIPVVGDADLVSYYAEVKYKFSPQLSAAVRWNQQLFGEITDRTGPVTWGKNAWRLDAAPAWRFTPHTQLKLQYSLQHGDTGARAFTHTLATQFTLRF
ncbi:MAG: hypothetical protein HZA93_20820 [Verrucomicrobia bacterium]|nr:hypothetical protein [Verrucomicrobiota bacterium]